MRRLLITAAALASLAMVASPRTASAATVGVSVNVGDPYRGAALHFRSEPDVVLVPSTRVYYVDDYDYDLYRYGGYWYFVEDGRWYRARNYRGPFVHVRTATVPRAIMVVPANYRRHWGGPPAHAVARGYYKDKDKDKGGPDRGEGRGKGKHRH